MTYAEKVLQNEFGFKSLNEFLDVIDGLLSHSFYSIFFKSKGEYQKSMKRLIAQINNDFHYVYYLKQQKMQFQLNWKLKVLKAHVEAVRELSDKQSFSINSCVRKMAV